MEASLFFKWGKGREGKGGEGNQSALVLNFPAIMLPDPAGGVEIRRKTC